MAREARITRPIRMTDAEWATFKNLLGTEWLRGQIAKAVKREQRQQGNKEAL